MMVCRENRWYSEVKAFVLFCRMEAFLFASRLLQDEFKGGNTMYNKVSTNLNFVEREKQVEEFQKAERRPMPPDIDYEAIQGLRLEARQKLQAIRPLSVGQASRISGVSPADVAVLLIYLEQRSGTPQA